MGTQNGCYGSNTIRPALFDSHCSAFDMPNATLRDVKAKVAKEMPAGEGDIR